MANLATNDGHQLTAIGGPRGFTRRAAGAVGARHLAAAVAWVAVPSRVVAADLVPSSRTSRRVRVEYYAPGAALSDPRPGDFVLIHGLTALSGAIQLAQSRRYRGAAARYAYWDHVALIADAGGAIIEALSEGVKRRHLDAYRGAHYAVVRFEDLSASERTRAVAVAERSVAGRERYDWLGLGALACELFAGWAPPSSGRGHTVCSALVGRALERLGEVFYRPAQQLLPADLAAHYGADGGKVTHLSP